MPSQTAARELSGQAYFADHARFMLAEICLFIIICARQHRCRRRMPIFPSKISNYRRPAAIDMLRCCRQFTRLSGRLPRAKAQMARTCQCRRPRARQMPRRSGFYYRSLYRHVSRGTSTRQAGVKRFITIWPTKSLPSAYSASDAFPPPFAIIKAPSRRAAAPRRFLSNRRSRAPMRV